MMSGFNQHPSGNTMLYRTRRLALGLLLALSLINASAQDKPLIKEFGPTPPRSVVYIGNSFFYFNNGIVAFMSPMVAEGMKGHPYRSSMITISGSGFDWHDVDSYFRPNAVGMLFEASGMMDCSQCPIHPTMKPVFHEYARKHSDTVRKHGSQPVFFMSWAYADKPEMTQALADAYTAAGNANQALVIPAGLAFARSIALRPDINLSAATTYATLFNRSPVGLSHTAGLPPAVVRHLQQVAWDTTQQYLGR
jgi:hypothetical protein